MERNSECWYKTICEEPTCDNCFTFKSMMWQFDHSGLPKSKYAPIKLDATEHNVFSYTRLAEIRGDIENFVTSGKNLYMCSDNPGTGKTSWAIKMLHTWFHHTAPTNIWHLTGMFVSTPKLLIQYKDFSNPLSKEYRKQLEEVDLLILDDVGVAGLTSSDYINLFVLVDTRILANKSTIFTSNLTSVEDLASVVGERTASRIWYTSEIVKIEGGDMRG